MLGLKTVNRSRREHAKAYPVPAIRLERQVRLFPPLGTSKKQRWGIESFLYSSRAWTRAQAAIFWDLVWEDHDTRKNFETVLKKDEARRSAL